MLGATQLVKGGLLTQLANVNLVDLWPMIIMHNEMTMWEHVNDTETTYMGTSCEVLWETYKNVTTTWDCKDLQVNLYYIWR